MSQTTPRASSDMKNYPKWKLDNRIHTHIGIYIYTLHTNIDLKHQSNEHPKNGPGREVLGIKKISSCWLDGSISHSLEHKTPPKATGADEHCEQFASSFHRWKPHKYTYIRDRGSIHKHFKPRKYWKAISSTARVSNRCMGAIRFA